MADHKLSRRTFMKSSLSTAAAASMAGPVLGALGANEKIRIGIIGTGGRGNHHAQMFRPDGREYHTDAEVVALCDVDERHLGQTAADLAASKPRVFKDFRDLLDMREVDAVIVATPCHWHGLQGLHTLRAGKDLYVEKPIGHTIEEGRLIVEAARSTGRVVQVGQQQRSAPHWQNAVQRIREGEIGRVTTVNVWNVWTVEEMGGTLGNPPDGEAPPGVDYDLWLGPAPRRPFNPARFHFGFYFFWDYSSGMVCAWGVHLFDIVNWALGPTFKSAAASGGIYVLKDARETPDTVSAVFDCGDYVMSYQMRHTNGFQPFGPMAHGDMDHGIEFVGARGLLHINRSGYQLYNAADRHTRKPYYVEKHEGNATYKHHRNFFDCIRSGKPAAVTAEAGQAAAVPGYLANISYLLGRSVRWDPEKSTIVGDAEAVKLLTKEYRAPWTLPV